MTSWIFPNHSLITVQSRIMMEGNMNLIDDITLFSQQEIDSMDFSNIMDVDDSDASLLTAEGIEAESLNSLLEQFEATESTDTDSMLESVETKIDLDMKEYNYDLDSIQNNSGTSSPVITTEVLDKIRSKNTNKRTAIMLPIGTPTTRKDKVLSDGSSKIQRLLKKKGVDKDDKNLWEVDSQSETNIQDIQSDHDYCYSSSNDKPITPKNIKQPTVSSPVTPVKIFETSAKEITNSTKTQNNITETLSSKSRKTDNLNLIETDLNKSVGEVSTSSEDMSTSLGSRDSGVEEGEILDIDSLAPPKESVFFPCPRNLKSKRSYRKHEESIISDESKYYDKIPAYFTTLSLPQKPPKREVNTGGISVADYITRDRSPTRDSDSMYSKLPDYYSCFTNSTKYDGQEENEIEIKIEPVEEIDNNGRPSRRTSRSRSSSSSSSSCGSSCSSCSRSSRGRSYDRFKRSERIKRRNSYSSTSLSSSRSRSRSSSSHSSSYSHNRSRSRSRSYSGDRKRSKRTVPRRYRSRQRSTSISRSRPSYRSRSRRRSRHRSRRSYSRSPSRSRSLERRRAEKKKFKEEEKQRQIKERRIVYVGRIPTDFTKSDLRKRFDRFGEITNVSTHFREYGDNYGFVTFAYTCDAFAAIEKGNAVPGEMKFDLCFGGRRQFCDTEYADLDGNNDEEDMFQPIVKPKAPVSDFDELLRQAQQKIKR